jgi:hypothetical protein
VWNHSAPAFILCLCLAFARAAPARAQSPAPDCASPGWWPRGFSLKDHTVFAHQGVYYLASIFQSPTHVEDRFAYARSVDLCAWEELDPILAERVPGAWDEWRVWAPFVFQENGVYYLFYTGVTADATQSILLATTTNPADPSAWQPQGVVFQPAHAGMVWPGRGAWSDARDPAVVRSGDRYYLYYTGRDAGGGIIGMATADDPAGPWRDWGAVLTAPGAMLESAGLVDRRGWRYLHYHRVLDGAGSRWQAGPTHAGPWSAPRPLSPGWAHEFWTAADGRWMASYVVTTGVAIRPLAWDDAADPPGFFIGADAVKHLWLPSISRDP